MSVRKDTPDKTVKADVGLCELCGKPATHVCHCPQCQDMLAEDGDNTDDGRPMCDQC